MEQQSNKIRFFTPATTVTGTGGNRPMDGIEKWEDYSLRFNEKSTQFDDWSLQRTTTGRDLCDAKMSILGREKCELLARGAIAMGVYYPLE